MSTTLVVSEASVGSVSIATRAAAYVELSKPKIAVLVLVTVAITAFVGSRGQLDPLLLLHTLLGVTLVAASSSAINHLLERRLDALMPRTAERPLPSGRLTVSETVVFAVLTIVGGLAYLAIAVSPLAALFGLATWVLYAWIYTPLKTRTWLNTTVGAVSGAAPVLIGWAATGAAWDIRIASIFMVLFLWQFPHFMAIAWLYRQQYRKAGMQMLTVTDPSGRSAGVQAVLAALALIPVSMIPALASSETIPFGLVAFVLGVIQLGLAGMFLWRLDDTSARRLLRGTLLYLPALLAALLWFVPFI
jgi:protoheme IX farnesyltransferase